MYIHTHKHTLSPMIMSQRFYLYIWVCEILMRLWLFQEVLVVMETYTAKAMGLTLQHSALLFSTMAWAVVLAMRWDVTVTQDGVSLEAYWSLPQTSALLTMHSPTAMVAGATLPCSTLILLSLLSWRLLSTKLELFQFPSEGKTKSSFLVCFFSIFSFQLSFH